jgi:hypothetical protein
MYGRAEATTGELLAANGRRGEAYPRDQVWTTGRAEGMRQMEAAFRRACNRPHRPDADPQPGRTGERSSRRCADGRSKAASATSASATTHASAYGEVEAVLRAEKGIDFLQIDYALDDRDAERRVLPLAASAAWRRSSTCRSAVAACSPAAAQAAPTWAGEIGCASWAQVRSKFVLSHPQ